MYETVAVEPAGADFPRNVLEKIPEDLMEGGMRVEQTLEWLQGRKFSEAMELAISVEVNAYDRYLVLQRESPTSQAREDFGKIADQEKSHLEKLSRLLEASPP